MTKNEAQEIVKEYLVRLQKGTPYEFVVMEDRTREEDFGWVFVYNSKEFVETGDLQWALAGNAPLIVDRFTGELHVTGTVYRVEHYIDEYRRKRARKT